MEVREILNFWIDSNNEHRVRELIFINEVLRVLDILWWFRWFCLLVCLRRASLMPLVGNHSRAHFPTLRPLKVKTNT